MKKTFDSHVRSHRLDILHPVAGSPPVAPVVGAPPADPVISAPMAPPQPPSRVDSSLPGIPQTGPHGDHAPAVETNSNLVSPINEIGTETAYSVITDVDLLGTSVGSAYNLDFLDAELD